jgi:hypothetical protein
MSRARKRSDMSGKGVKLVRALVGRAIPWSAAAELPGVACLNPDSPGPMWLVPLKLYETGHPEGVFQMKVRAADAEKAGALVQAHTQADLAHQIKPGTHLEVRRVDEQATGIMERVPGLEMALPRPDTGEFLEHVPIYCHPDCSQWQHWLGTGDRRGAGLGFCSCGQAFLGCWTCRGAVRRLRCPGCGREG